MKTYDLDLAKLKATPNINEPWLETWTATIAEVYRLRAAVERLTRERDKALGHIHLVREEMWVDYCLARNRTDLPSTEFNARPVMRSIDAAIRALENPNG